MGTIVERTRKDGTTSFRAQIIIKRDGQIAHQESRSFPRRTTAAAWMKRREKELKAPGGLDGAGKSKATVGDAIRAYIDDNEKAIGKTKAQVLRSIECHSIAELNCHDVTSDKLVEWAKGLLTPERGPSTVGNYMSHLSAVFDLARPAWGIPLDPEATREAAKACKRLGIITRSQKRDRRPTLDELDALLTHFRDKHSRGRAMPMHELILFAIFSTRRQEEITRIEWADFDQDGARILVRDMKHPGEKLGNDMWCELPPEAMSIINRMPRESGKPQIFPYSADAISASFTRACKLLGIEDLRFHDLRHEGVSWLFEMGRTIPQAACVSGHRSWQSLQRYGHIRQTGNKFEGWSWLQ